MTHILIIGGGAAGLMSASQIRRHKPDFQVTVIEPSETHTYQPTWTLVGANSYNFEATQRPMASVMPEGVHWVKDYAAEIKADANEVVTRQGQTIGYDFLIVAPGLVMAPEMVEGLTEALGKGVVCSNYTNPRHTWEVLKNFKGGTALFTQPTTPIKCGGAPQKIMYLADDHFRKQGLREQTKVVFAAPGGVIFGVKPIAKTLMEVVDRKGIHLRFKHQLRKVDGEKRIAWFKLADGHEEHNPVGITTERDGNLVGIHFDMLHLAPPQAAPNFIRESPLANAAGWLDVDHGTLQHKAYANIFGIGDVAALPTAKTAAAIRKQVPIALENIFLLADQKALSNRHYNGYSSCPLVTGYGKMVLAEFDYDNNFTPDPKLKQMLVFNSDKEHLRLWWLKKYILPRLYWNKMLKGKRV